MNRKELFEQLGHNNKFLLEQYIKEGTIIVLKSTGWRQFEFAEGFNAELCKKHHEEIVYESNSNKMKKLWQNKEFKDKVSKSQSEHSKAMWQNEEYRNKVISNTKAAWTEDKKIKQSKEIKEKLSKPEVHKKLREANKANWLNPERRKKQSKAMKAYFTIQSNRNRHSKLMKACMTDALKAKISARTKLGQALHGAYKKIAKASIEMWKNPEHGKKVHEGLKRNGSYSYSYDHKRSIAWLKSKGLTIEQEKQYPTEPNLHCDVYVKDFDLWMEFHYYWGHGGEPFDPHNPEHVKTVELWKRRSIENKQKYNLKKSKFDACISTWTYDDIRRRKDAEANDLNWHTPYSYQEFQSFFNRLSYNDMTLYPWDCYQKIMTNGSNKKLSGHNCTVKEISSNLSKQFLDAYHYQGSLRTVSDVRLGLFYKNELVSVATFGKPRYNQNYDWEALRYCVKRGYTIFGGATKLYNYFETNYKPKSIVSYQDLSKFKGNFHERLGYRLISESKSKHWYNYDTGVHLTDNLVRQRGVDCLLGTSFGRPEHCNMTNEQILRKLGFVEIWDEGQRTYIKTY